MLLEPLPLVLLLLLLVVADWLPLRVSGPAFLGPPPPVPGGRSAADGTLGCPPVAVLPVNVTAVVVLLAVDVEDLPLAAVMSPEAEAAAAAAAAAAAPPPLTKSKKSVFPRSSGRNDSLMSMPDEVIMPFVMISNINMSDCTLRPRSETGGVAAAPD